VDAVGVSDSSSRHRIQSGVWDTLLPGVYSLAGLQIQWRQRLMAAVLSSGNLAAVSHRAALSLWRLDGRRGEPVEITVPKTMHPPAAGMFVHCSSRVDYRDNTEVERITCTSVPRTLLER